MSSAVVRGVDYAAQVVKVGAADDYLMAQIDIKELFDGANPDDLPWATYLLPVGARANEGEFTPVMEGDWVWVDFPYPMAGSGRVDTRRPRIKGAMLYAPEETPTLPHEVFGGPDKLVHKRADAEPMPVEREPNTAKVITFGGITVEMEREGAYRITHRQTGTAFEITEEGHSVNHSEKELYMSSKEKMLVESGLDLFVEVKSGKATIKADEIDLGRDGLEPMVLGDMLAAFFEKVKAAIENHFHIGNLGAPTSTLVAASGPLDFIDGLKSGKCYSQLNRTQ